MRPVRSSVRAQIVERRTYLRPLDEEAQVFETYEQSIDRIIGHQRWLWERQVGRGLHIKENMELEELRSLILNRKVTLSGRTRWLGGTDVSKRREISNFNCSALEIRDIFSVVDALWLLLNGAGVGFRPIVGSLNGFAREVEEIEVIRSKMTMEVWENGIRGRETNKETFDRKTGIWTISIGDSAEAWAKSIGKLLAGKYPARKLIIDFSQIRPAGLRLKGYGWISSGDESIAIAYKAIAELMSRRAGKLLTRIDIMDVLNWLGTILSSRRSSEICLMEVGEPEWEDFAVAKKDYYLPEVNQPQRSQSNNSLMFTKKPERHELEHIFNLMADAGGSEPGFFNKEALQKRAPYAVMTNPCSEIALGDKSLCNLVETILPYFNEEKEEDLHRAHFLVSRANYRQTCVDLDDGILSRGWHELNQFLRLCGAGVTGAVAWEHVNDPEAWQKLRRVANEGADSMADELNLPRSQNVTCVKPSGCLPGWAVVVTDDGILTMSEIMEEHPVGQVWADKDIGLPDRDGGFLKGTKTFDNGVAPTIEIKTTFNLPLCSTAEHKWRLSDGSWKKACDLEKGDELVVVPGLYESTTDWSFKKLNHYRLFPHGMEHLQEDFRQPLKMTDELAWFLGYLYGDGAMSVQKYRVRFVDACESNLRRAQSVLKDVFGISPPDIRKLDDRNASTLEVGCVPLWRWLLANDLYKDLSSGVPACVRKGSKRHCIYFIAGLIDSDGTITSDGQKVVFTQSCPEFTSSFQQVAWAVGLAFGRSPNTQGMNFQQHKGIFLCTLSGHSSEDSVNLLWEAANKAKNKPTRVWARKHAVRVLETSPGLPQPTADIEVEGEHRYFAFGGVETHNTSSKTMSLEGQEIPEGAHKPLGRFIFNNVILSKHDPLVKTLREAGYYIFDHPMNSWDAIVRIPVEYSHIPFEKVERTLPNGKTVEVEVNLETAIDQLERYRMLQENYVDHNTSITVSYSPDEVPAIIDWFMEHWDCYVGVAFIYRSDPSKTAADLGYPYMPQEVVDKETFHAYASTLSPIDLTGMTGEDEVDTGSECAGGACPVR